MWLDLVDKKKKDLLGKMHHVPHTNNIWHQYFLIFYNNSFIDFSSTSVLFSVRIFYFSLYHHLMEIDYFFHFVFYFFALPSSHKKRTSFCVLLTRNFHHFHFRAVTFALAYMTTCKNTFHSLTPLASSVITLSILEKVFLRRGQH